MTMTTNDGNERETHDVHWYVQHIAIGISLAVGIFYTLSAIAGAM